MKSAHRLAPLVAAAVLGAGCSHRAFPDCNIVMPAGVPVNLSEAIGYDLKDCIIIG